MAYESAKEGMQEHFGVTHRQSRRLRSERRPDCCHWQAVGGVQASEILARHRGMRVMRAVHNGSASVSNKLQVVYCQKMRFTMQAVKLLLSGPTAAKSCQ